MLPQSFSNMSFQVGHSAQNIEKASVEVKLRLVSLAAGSNCSANESRQKNAFKTSAELGHPPVLPL